MTFYVVHRFGIGNPSVIRHTPASGYFGGESLHLKKPFVTQSSAIMGTRPNPSPLNPHAHYVSIFQKDKGFRCRVVELQSRSDYTLPSKSLLQKLSILADFVHQCVVVSLHSHSLEERSFRHRRGEECERSVCHHLKNKM